MEGTGRECVRGLIYTITTVLLPPVICMHPLHVFWAGSIDWQMVYVI